ncbi:arginase family protein [Actinomadura miaoliensis]|uniref:Arginase family protein n=1 Tax=Actinomadura miaoliensis TaxID=430685 RepID=A0ABP7V110_9ACTN
MGMIVVPYHQDERLSDGYIPLPLADDLQVVDPELPDGDIWRRLAALDDAAADEIAASVSAGGPTTVLSGDCLIGMAVLAGAQRAGVHPGIVWFDAHGDVHTLDTTTSGYLGGLALRLLLGAHPDLLARPLGLHPVAEDRTVLVDARDLDPPEAEYLRTSAIRRSGVADLDVASLPDGPLIVHVDVDVTDPDDLPALLFPAPGGPPAAQVIAAVHRILETGRVTALDIACPWQPTTQDSVQQGRSDLLRQLISGYEAPSQST